MQTLLDNATMRMVLQTLGAIAGRLFCEFEAASKRNKELGDSIDLRIAKMDTCRAPLFPYHLLRCNLLMRRQTRFAIKNRQTLDEATAAIEAQAFIATGNLQPAIEVLYRDLDRLTHQRTQMGISLGGDGTSLPTAEELDLKELIDMLREASQPAHAVS